MWKIERKLGSIASLKKKKEQSLKRDGYQHQIDGP